MRLTRKPRNLLRVKLRSGERFAPAAQVTAEAVTYKALDSAPRAYRGVGVCATITPRLNSSTIRGSRRTSVGRFANVI